MTIQRTIIGSCLVLLLVFVARVVVEYKKGGDLDEQTSWQVRMKDTLEEKSVAKKNGLYAIYDDNGKKLGYYSYSDYLKHTKNKKKKSSLVERTPASMGNILPSVMEEKAYEDDRQVNSPSRNNFNKRSNNKSSNPDGQTFPGTIPGHTSAGVGSGGSDNYAGSTTSSGSGSGTGTGANGGAGGSVGGTVTGPSGGGCIGDACKLVEYCSDKITIKKNGKCPGDDLDLDNPKPVDEAKAEQAPRVACDKPSGGYLDMPTVSLTTSSVPDKLLYCVGNSLSGSCCDPYSGAIYTGSFQPGMTDGNYCVSAVAYKGQVSSATSTCYYEVSENLISLNITMPERTHFQTQQLHRAIKIDSENFRSPAHSFIQLTTTVDPGADACNAFGTNSFDEMMTSLGIKLVEFKNVEEPFQIPLALNNSIQYGQNFLISAIERQGEGGIEYKCVKNNLVLKDFHIESSLITAPQATPTDGTYQFQGHLNSFGSFGAAGKVSGAGGVVLEHGFLNIIN